ncbi:hypothetical protein OIDMADRAFT_101530 [Oidiodendron maius Zn]|uniref:Amino acid permease/ SLC12A domain-containing protein n=1 Tax=Oidiodendron maius (strain Zn) TaxID=913774 RepID=A0A0C3CZW9_OIDMZ|nr:hypothetical protein OIDMADRAFT_101530 [Oidiodendron maius Zn]
MITLSGTIGNGLFLGAGTSLAVAGPGGAFICYILIGTVIASVISCLCEMTALMPVNAPVMEFPRRFVDRGVGFAIGWMYWFAWCVGASDQLVAIARTINFKYDDGRTFLDWNGGNYVDSAVWISIFLFLAICVNMLPAKVYGQLEYFIGCFKLVFMVMLIMLLFILDVMKPRAEAYYSQSPGRKYWDQPFSFFNSVYAVTDEDGNVQRHITGTIGTFLNMWTTCVHVMFAYTGMDIIAGTAAESKALADAESMKMGSRKISIRVATLYSLAMLLVACVVPRDHPFINGGGQSASSQSPFVIAVVEAGIPNLAHVFNAAFVICEFSCAASAIYLSSRVLHTLALQDQTGPEWITKRLQKCRGGVPVRAVLVTGSVAMISYMGRSGAPLLRLGELESNMTISLLIVYIVICATYLCFYKTLEEIKLCNTISDAQIAMFDRDHPRYPYKSHGQWMKALYGLIACTLIVVFNGIGPFLQRPFDIRQIVAYYVGIPVFVLLILGYKINKHGFHIYRWKPERSNDLRNTIQASRERRKGRLEFPGHGLTKENLRIFLNWVWVWMK